MLPIMRSKITIEDKTVKRFQGINVRDDYASGEICEELNMSSNMYPSLCTRALRKTASGPGRQINGIGNHEGLIYTYSTPDGRAFLNYAGEDYEYTNLAFTENMSAGRSFASLSDSVMIIPDNVIFTPSTGEFSAICVNQYGDRETAAEKLALETNNSSLLDGASSWHLGYLSHNRLTCRSVPYSHSGNDCEFYCFAFDSVLKRGDVVNVKMSVKSDEAESGDAYSDYRKMMKNGITLKIKDVVTSKHYTAAGEISESIELIFDDYAIEQNGYTDLVFDEITVERAVPELKRICSFNNRIWGITERELCCSKLGDASEWNDFSVDSYGTLPYASFSTPAPTEGKFTAVTSFGNYIYAFKENAIHKLYGDNSDEFVLKTIEANGVADGKADTLAKCETAVFYCSYDGIYKFDGSSARKISYCLNDGIDYICASCDSEKYYVLCSENGKKFIYVYDIRRKLWHREDADGGIGCLCRTGNDVIAASENKIIYMNSGPEEAEPEVFKPEWNFTVKFDEKLFEKKGFGKIAVRYSLGKDAYFTVRAIYDDATGGAVCGAKHDEVPAGGGYMHMAVRRCRCFYLQFKGRGSFCLKSLKMQYYRGSEI